MYIHALLDGQPLPALGTCKQYMYLVLPCVLLTHVLPLQVGQPLPGMGTCKHYRHSYRWLRFPCCGMRWEWGGMHGGGEEEGGGRRGGG